MIITISIDTSNSAFDVEPMAELRTILAQAADKLENTPAGEGGTLYDTNGNRVGQFTVSPYVR